MVEEVVGAGRDDAGSAVGGRGDHAAAGGVLLVYGHGGEGNRVEWRQRVAQLAAGVGSGVKVGEPASQTRSAAADVQAPRQGALGGNPTLNGGAHDVPERKNPLLDVLSHRF